MELIQLLSQYPAATLVFVAWPLLFVWLLWWTMKEHAKREERLMAANESWRVALEKLAEKIDQLGDNLLERLRDELRR
ncbi:MAG: hypothetical protein HPY71_01775 [Firmicutes bacterium]|nr:hypothetical protein [Bacillota bacterium]